MGRVGRFLSFIKGTGRNESRSDIGAGDIIEAVHFSPPGDDSPPMPGDYSANMENSPSGTFVAVGYIDPNNESSASPGEKRIYARGGDGQQVSQVYQKNDGSVEISNLAGGSVLMESGGDVLINGVRITTDGEIITPQGVVLNNHKHSQGSDSNGDAEQDTGGPLNA